MHGEIASREEQRRLHQQTRWGQVLGTGTILDNNEVGPWVSEQVQRLQNIIDNINVLTSDLEHAVGAPGEAGNVQEIIAATHGLGRMYGQIIEWSENMKRVRAPFGWGRVIRELVFFPDRMLSSIEEYGPRLEGDIVWALGALQVEGGSKRIEVDAILRLDSNNLDNIMTEI